MTWLPRCTLWRWALMLLTLQLLGCGPGPSGTTERQDESPRTRFDWIVEQFKQHCSGSSIVVPNRTGESLVVRFVVDDVSYRVAGSDQPAAPYTAEMTIKSSTHYSLLTSPSSSGDSDSDSTDPRASSAAGPQGSPTDAPPTKQSPLARMTAEELLGRKSEEATATYQFAFEQDRWVLKTEDVDPSVRESIMFALRRQ